MSPSIDVIEPKLNENLSHLNEETLNNLLELLSKIKTRENLLILDQSLSNLINYLTPFSKLKSEGRFDKIIWYKSLPIHKHQNEELRNIIEQFDGLILIIEYNQANLNILKKFNEILTKQFKQIKISLIIPNLGKNNVFELNQVLNLEFQTFDKILRNNSKWSNLNLSSSIKLFNWVVNPFYYKDDNFISLGMHFGGLESYFNQPLEQLNQLSDDFIKIITPGESNNLDDLIKLKNIYGKGDHSKLLINLIQNEKLPEFFNANLNKLEQDFYNNKLSGNTDLIVLERNLDYLPIFFNQLNYQGLIDDLFEIEDEYNQSFKNNEESYKLNEDELFKNLKDLNFASIGNKLNKLAKYIQFQYQQKDNLKDLKEIKKLVNNLGNLTTKQDLIKKHTSILESILTFIKANDRIMPFNQNEFFLQFQNDLFDLDYKQQINYLIRFLDENYQLDIILLSIILISLINDGIKEKDFDIIKFECIQNYTIESLLVLNQLIDIELIHIIPTANNDFLGALTGLSLSNNQPSHHQSSSQPSTPQNENLVSYDGLNQLGITAGQKIYQNNYNLINKFWNLHPLIEEEYEATSTTIDTDDDTLVSEYPHASFTLPSNTVPLLYRLVESLYFRDFLKYKPTNNLSRRPNWDNLGLDNMFKGKTVDINLCDKLDEMKTISKNKEYIIIILIGGITRSEITTFKYLQQKFSKNGYNKEIIILTSGIVNSKKFFHLFKST